ncbi:MAG: glycosyltransferase [Candidatus Nanoarchaeia archaeon]|nr:glycosyltransferase [Candidatus Haiyanarchaeum thermophilum]MCW1302796.1 glycosyltransferase [Candidatus Haiyanarchaeum thermophilum]MCW1303477.1 glycosyltransferase [Candidatus Haiyanarchaeum thermophilum]MCW1306657.1 glycosyltransferase [Candidatus Haiyanarchaeum thermophilum]MCW1307387.1 glycosyltransferase [Candidatus Haiyanarchaeum thermophilum]
MISVIIPARNEEKNLAELLEDLRNQTYRKKFEIIVVDGKSKDRTREIARNYGCKVVIQKKLGPSNARNLGVKKSRGTILVFLDADYRVNRDFLREIEKAFRKREIKCATPTIIPLQKNWIQKALAIQTKLATQRLGAEKFPKILRKHIFDEVGGWDEKLDFGEDRDFGMRVLREGYRTILIRGAIAYVKLVDSPTKLFKQGRWYGRTIFPYIRKTKDLPALGGMLVYSSFIPLLILSAFLKAFLYLFLLDFFVLLSYSFAGFLSTRSPYAFLIMPVNIIRGFGEFVGMIEGILVKKRGKV